MNGAPETAPGATPGTTPDDGPEIPAVASAGADSGSGAEDGLEDRPEAGRTRRWLISPLTLRILSINVAALLALIVGLVLLGPYRDKLIDAEIDALRRQAEVLAGAVGEGAIAPGPFGYLLTSAPVEDIIRRLQASSGLRLRLFLPSGALVVDSRRLPGTQEYVFVRTLPGEEDGWLAAAGRWVNRGASLLRGGDAFETYAEAPVQRAQDYAEVGTALAGAAEGMVRRAGDRLVLSVAVPVQRYRRVAAALMVSREDWSVGKAMEDVHLTLAGLFLFALVMTVLFSIYLSRTIARPMLRLAGAAERIRRGVGKSAEELPDFASRRDEIGDLSRALRDMTEALDRRLDATARFASDVSHELRNPLTSLRSAIETTARVTDREQQKRLMAIILDDVHRLDRLITDIADASRLDFELNRTDTAPVDLGRLVPVLVESFAVAREGGSGDPGAGGGGGVRVAARVAGAGPHTVSGIEDRLVQVLQNLIENAVGFSPAGETVVLAVLRRGAFVEVAVEDAGPGIPEAKLEAVFDRFYSARPKEEKFGIHSGLGLAIARQIAEAHKGTLRAENRRDTQGRIVGARFVLRLPAA